MHAMAIIARICNEHWISNGSWRNVSYELDYFQYSGSGGEILRIEHQFFADACGLRLADDAHGCRVFGCTSLHVSHGSTGGSFCFGHCGYLVWILCGSGTNG